MKPDDFRQVLGVNPVLELLKTEPQAVKKLFVTPAPRRAAINEIIELARAHHVPCETRDARELERIGRDPRHQGVVALAEGFVYADFDAALGRLAATQAATVVVLDCIQDPHNFGAIVRSAAALGAGLVVTPKDRAAPVTAPVERASAGAVSRVPIARVTNLKRALAALKEAGFWLFGAAGESRVSLVGYDFPPRVALVMGNEGEGLRPGTREAVDVLLRIPMAAEVESLNVSNAAAIFLYEIARRRLAQSGAR